MASKAGNGKIYPSTVPNSASGLLLPRRLFIVDGIISLPVALSGFFVLPDVPEISNPWYLTKKVRKSV